MSTGASDSVFYLEPTQHTIGRQSRIYAFLASPELLILSFILSVLFEFKPVLYLFFFVSVISINWLFSFRRWLIWLVLAIALLVFFTTIENINASLTFLLVSLGVFSSKSLGKPIRVEQRLLAFVVLCILAIGLLFTNVFDPNDGMVSQNFIPIIGLYVLLVARDYPRAQKLILALGFALFSFFSGSRSGTLVFLLLTSYFISIRLTWLLIGILIAVYFFTSLTSIPLSQFERNYEAEEDPRLFIWAEYLDAALSGTLFRQESFYFMEAWGLDRNFHNSFFEAYYRLGPFCLIVFYGYFNLLFKRAGNNFSRSAILLALAVKALFDTFLFFNPIDIIVFRLIGEELFCTARRPRS